MLLKWKFPDLTYLTMCFRAGPSMPKCSLYIILLKMRRAVVWDRAWFPRLCFGSSSHPVYHALHTDIFRYLFNKQRDFSPSVSLPTSIQIYLQVPLSTQDLLGIQFWVSGTLRERKSPLHPNTLSFSGHIYLSQKYLTEWICPLWLLNVYFS